MSPEKSSRQANEKQAWPAPPPSYQEAMNSTRPGEQNLYLNTPILKLNGVVAPPELMEDLLEVVVDESLYMPSMFTFKIQNVYVGASEDTKPWKNEKYFNIGDSITLGFEPSKTLDRKFLSSEAYPGLIMGEITGIEVKFSDTSKAHIVVRGYDRSHRLHRGRHNRSFTNQTDTTIVESIAKEAGISTGQIDPSGTTYEYVFQENQTNMEFLRERAARIGFELFVQENKLYFRKPQGGTQTGGTQQSGEKLVLEWLKDIKSFDVRVTSAEQVSSVQVNSWNYKTKEPFSAIATTEELVTKTGNGNGSISSKKFKMTPPPKMTVVDRPVNTVPEATKMAQALCNELGGEFVTADAKATGNPKIRPGKVLSLQNMGTRYSGDYYITETRHHYIHRNYTTNFTVRGLREGSLLSTLPPKTHLQPGQTLLVGLVTNNYDPEGLGRVRVKFPTLTMDHESQWARVVGLGAGIEKGFYCLPEVDDEVLVAFEHGDIHRPYIIGGVWNGKDKTVETVDNTIQQGQGQVSVRTIKTRTGHLIRFVEEDIGNYKQGIYIQTAGNHSIKMSDIGESIEIKTAGKHSIKMSDKIESNKIEIKTNMGHSVTLDDIMQNVSVETVLGSSITLDDIAREINIAPTPIGGKITITAPPLGTKPSIEVLGNVEILGQLEVRGPIKGYPTMSNGTPCVTFKVV
jgi:phage protein D